MGLHQVMYGHTTGSYKEPYIQFYVGLHLGLCWVLEGYAELYGVIYDSTLNSKP